MSDEIMSDLLKNTVQDGMIKKYNLDPSQEVNVVEKTMMDYEGRMRTLGLDKFNGLCYLSAINLYKSEAAREKQDTVGGLVIYFEDVSSERVFKALDHRANMDDDESIFQSAGDINKELAEELNTQLVSKGYPALTMSDPMVSKNDLIEGIPFHKSQYGYYEAELYLWKKKVMVVSLTLALKAIKD